MRQWFRIYNQQVHRCRDCCRRGTYGVVGLAGLRQIERERALPLPAPGTRPAAAGAAAAADDPRRGGHLHQAANGRRRCSSAPRSRRSSGWSTGAKHNQALHLAGDEYRRRVLAFFERHLADAGRAGARRRAAPDELPAPHVHTAGRSPLSRRERGTLDSRLRILQL